MHNSSDPLDHNGLPPAQPPSAAHPASAPLSAMQSEIQPVPVQEPTVEEPLLIVDDMLVKPEPADARRDFERDMSYAPPLTLILISVNVVIFAWQVLNGALQSQTAIIESGALARGPVLQGEVWRLLSAIFLHGGGKHLIGNCIVLFIVGMACEHALGFDRTATVYFLSGLAGSLLSILMSPGPSVDASGAVFGVTGSLVVFLYKHQEHFYVRDKRIGWVLGFWALYSITTGFLDPYIDNFAHIGGLVAGGLTTLFLRPAALSEVRM